MNSRMKKIAITLLTLIFSPAIMANCQVSLSKHDVSYGQIKQTDTVATVKQWSTLDDRQLQLIAYCSEPQKIALFFDGKMGDQAFSFGDKSRLIVTASHATLDGKAVQLNHTTNHGQFMPMGKIVDEHPVRAGQGLIPVQGGEVLVGQQFSLTLTLKPTLVHSEFNVKDKTDLSSHIQVSVETE
jgi:hypothetical protein